MLTAIVTFAILSGSTSPALSAEHFLQSIGAKLDREASAASEQSLGRPVKLYTAKKSSSQIQTLVRKTLLKEGWTSVLTEEANLTVYTKGDQEVTLSSGHASETRIYVERCPAWVRTLSERRSKFIEELDESNVGFDLLLGEGGANEVLFSAGETDKLFYIFGQYFQTQLSSGKREPLMLAAFGRVDGKVVKLWESELAPGKESSGYGTLSHYLAHRKWHFKKAPTDNDLNKLTPFSYSSENSGDNGTSLGFIDVTGKLNVTHGVRPMKWVVTLQEERYLKSHFVK